tara:strand:+ start:2056 stop:3165 length:1110 start_codon:yes stop_codon:yes gene_type:complete
MRLFSLLFLISVAQATEPFLLSSINLDKPVSFNQVLEKLDQVASKKKHLVSLGESHLHPFSARKVQEIFIDRYLENSSDFKFCAESIKDFLEHSAGKKLIDSAAETLVTQNNSPSQTDFRSCKDSRDAYFTYSGFFHQLPFAKPFPLEFRPSPVITDREENIRAQVKSPNTLFIIQMELEFVEMVTQARLLSRPPQSVVEFKQLVGQLVAKIDKIKEAQETIFESEQSARNKSAVILSRDGLFSLTDDAYLVLTDLDYRKNLQALPLAATLTKLDDEALQKLLVKLGRDPVYVTAGIQEPNENGELFQSGYGTVPWLFPANSTFMEFRVAQGENLIISADPTAKSASCVAYKKLGPSRVDCNEYLKDLP